MQGAANQAKCVERRFESELPEGHYLIATNVPGRVVEFDSETNSGDRRGEAFRWRRFAFPLAALADHAQNRECEL
jgi:hypothetical protein